MKLQYIFILTLFLSSHSFSENLSNQSFSKSKKILEKQIYQNIKNRKTIYCDASFTLDKKIIAPEGFYSKVYKKRAKKVEWEHIVPAENFGRAFVQWRDGTKKCVTSKGKKYKGRRCAEKMSKEYRYMQADMFNLYPAIGAVNALRSNYNFTILSGEKSDFGSCAMKIANRKAEPPKKARGNIARAYFYMAKTYSHFSLSSKQKKLMLVWDKEDPVDRFECIRSKKITRLQKNKNSIVQSRCEALNLW